MLIEVRSGHSEIRQLLLPVPGMPFLGGGEFQQDVAVLFVGSIGQAPVQMDVLEFPLDVPLVSPGIRLRPAAVPHAPYLLTVPARTDALEKPVRRIAPYN
jgi:hypothetical protein